VILIVTIKDDIHALAIQRELKRRGYKRCYILECDKLSSTNRISWSINSESSISHVFTSDGDIVDIHDIKIIWWRRPRADQLIDSDINDPYQIRLINNDCRGAINGILTTAFEGKWISSPEATDRSSNKIYQLTVARECGFRIPNTLVSQSVDEVKEFCNTHPNGIIVKPVIGTAGPLMFTQFLNDPDKFDNNSYRVCPAIYQEYIPGKKHIRLNCFGDKSYAALIESEKLDWRPDLNIPISNWVVPDDLHASVRSTLDLLGLEMGIVDLKLSQNGEVTWLEVNPQGQFLFLEKLASIPLIKYFVEYLLNMEETVNH